MKDNIFSNELSKIDDFDFDESVTAVFPDMIKRSVPGYETIIRQIGAFARLFVTENSNVYDLGSSLGAASLSVRGSLLVKGVNIVAIDNSAAMVSRSKNIFASYESDTKVKVIQGDIENCNIKNASMVILNFTLQFVELSKRQKLIQRIYDGLNKNGILILSEKLLFTNTTTQSFIEELHHEFKRENGYSELEISQKREALQDILIPESFDTHRNRLLSSGFRSADIWYQQYNFASFVAIK